MIQKDELTTEDLKGAGLEQLKVKYNNDVELKYHVCHLKVAVLSKAQCNSDEGDVSKPISFERHISKTTKPHPCFYNNDYTYLVDLSIEHKYTTSITKHYPMRYYKEGIKDMIPERWSKEVCCYHFEALNDLRIKSVVRVIVKKKWGYGFLTSIVVMRFDDKKYEFSNVDLPRCSENNVEDIRTVIKNKVKDIQLEVQSYQRTLKLTKPTMFFEGINQRIPFTVTAMHKGVMYLNQYNIKYLMKLSEVKNFYDGILVKIQDNLIDMLTKNKLGSGTKSSSKGLRSMLKDVLRQLIPVLCKKLTYLGLRKKYRLNLKNDMPPRDKTDDPNITMEEYIRLEEEKAQKHGKVFNSETAKYGKLKGNPFSFLTVEKYDNRMVKFYNMCIDLIDFAYMAPLPPREQRHPFLRYHRLEYSDRDIANFKERLERIHDKGTHRVQVLDFKGMPELMRHVLYAKIRMEHRNGDGVVVFSSQAWSSVFETRGPLVRELILEFLSMLRFRVLLHNTCTRVSVNVK
uniref:Uncharacterized protein n=1 Tax=Tanacetum cinerariifolium TaxID=118510 RepID=A0A6L2J976_TANCI|nr:hypothetical protein [Tanacetum cinerariifolium]